MRGQTSIEYVIAISVLLLIFIAMFQLSYDMNSREQYLASYFEGEKLASKISLTAGWALILGNNSNITIPAHTYPPQNLIISQAQVISFGTDNRTIAISQMLANSTPNTGLISSNQNLGVAFNGTNITISQES